MTDGNVPPPQTPLQRLIAQAMERQGLSFRDVARRSGTPGVTFPTVQKLREKPLVRPPQANTVRALASGLGVPEKIVQGAIGETFGYRDEVPGQSGGFSLARALAEEVETLPQRDQGHILWALGAMVEAVKIRMMADGEERQGSARGEQASRILDLAMELDDEARARVLADLERARKDRRPSVNGVG